jgi:S1-C subfamily serine protease
MPRNHPLTAFSQALAETIAIAARSVVSVDDGTRLTATGIVLSPGIVVTTSHGTERDDDLLVLDSDGARYSAVLIGRDPETDIAVLKTEAALPPLARTDEITPQVGQLVLALGRPGGHHLTATLGLLSTVRETQTQGVPEYILSTDADLYPGVSGGPLLDSEGRMLGLLDRLYRRGMGVALGLPLVVRVVDALLAHGRVPRGYLGIRTQIVGLPDALRVTLGLAQTHGLMLVAVEASGPADEAGLLLGDTLVGIGGEPIADIDDFRGHLAAGRETTFEVIRGGQRIVLSGTVGTAPA